MMPFFPPSGRYSSTGLSIRTTRILATVALAGAPAAVVIRALGPGTTDGSPHEIASLTVMMISLLTGASIFGSRLHRIAGEKPKRLDEMELQLRHNALATSYSALTMIVMLGAIYAQIAGMAELWLPRNRSDWNPIFVCLFLYALLLPTAVLAWRMKEEKEEG
jgi:cytochrome bd-type quinol oxidase subunit 1